MTIHWTEQSIEDFAFRIAADFITQIEDMMEEASMSKKELATKLGVTKGRISQMFNNPGNLSLETMVEYSRALNMKVSVVAYDDNDQGNDNGPINSDIFRICWEKAGKPKDFWAFPSEGLSSEKGFDTASTINGQPFTEPAVAANEDAISHLEVLRA